VKTKNEPLTKGNYYGIKSNNPLEQYPLSE
jgi:hypothetical protein